MADGNSKKKRKPLVGRGPGSTTKTGHAGSRPTKLTEMQKVLFSKTHTERKAAAQRRRIERERGPVAKAAR